MIEPIPKSKPIIFLDLDGVICLPPYKGALQRHFETDATKLLLLEMFCEKKDAEIVVVSMKRLLGRPACEAILGSCARFLSEDWKTEFNGKRWLEVLDYLTLFPTDNYVIIDDSVDEYQHDLAECIWPKIVGVNPDYGLVMGDLNKANKILK